VPSLDAADERVFRAVNRPHPSLRLSAVLRGLADFRREYRGQLWLEIMLVKGVNDSPAHIAALKKAAALIGPDRIHLNTVVRPPAERWARPLSEREMSAVRRRLGPGCEVAAFIGGRAPARAGAGDVERVLATVQRRPQTAGDLERSLGLSRKNLEVILARLLGTGRIRKRSHGGMRFFEPGEAPGPKSGRTTRPQRNHPRERGG
jgi:wyosine [tRNA(Phe)-imidazoG37] synthetase (radical SAM superfamily)